MSNNLGQDDMAEKLKMIADHYGLESLLRQLAWECAEIVVEANNSERYGCRSINIIDGIIDVGITIDQILYLFGTPESYISEKKSRSIDMQIKRIQQEKTVEDM